MSFYLMINYTFISNATLINLLNTILINGVLFSGLTSFALFYLIHCFNLTKCYV